MKKLVLMIALLLAFALPVISQSGIYSGGMSGIAKHDLRKTGLIVRPEIGFVYGENWDHIPGMRNEQFITFGADAGYQISPHIYFGGGLGCFVSLYSYYNGHLGLLGYRDKIDPFYASFRWYWFDGLSSPFLELEAGGEISVGGDGADGSYFINPAIGYNIKNFDIKISAPIIRGVGVCATFGYNFLIKKK